MNRAMKIHNNSSSAFIHLLLISVCQFLLLPAFSAPSLVSPSDYSIYRRDTVGSIAFQWTSVSGALEYWLNVFPSGNASSPVVDKSVGNVTTYSLNPGSWANNVYIWQVKVRTSAGWSTYSNPARQFIADTPPGAPTISGPANGSSFNLGSSANFTWTGPSGVTIARYNLRIVPGSDLNGTPAYNSEPSGNSQTVNFTTPTFAGGSHIWSVRAIKATPSDYNQSTYETTIGWGTYASTRTFTITIPPPSPPNPSSPSDYGIFNRNQTSSITHSWSSVSGATAYWLYVFPSGDSAHPKFNGSVGNVTSYALSTSGWSDGEYTWLVRAGNAGGWSGDSTSRRYIADTPPSTPTISAPASGSSFRNEL